MSLQKCHYEDCEHGDNLDLRPCPSCNSVYYDTLACMEKDTVHKKVCALIKSINKSKIAQSSSKEFEIAKNYSKTQFADFHIYYSKCLGRGSFGNVILY